MDLQFGPYRLRRTERQLVGPQGPVELSARSFDILSLLLDRPEEVIGKEEIFERVWQGLVVEENTLQVHVSALRKALDTGMIMTVHGRGYKYAGPRPVVAASANASPPATATDRKPIVVVLPFNNVNGEADQQFLGDGIASDLADLLARFREFAVIGQHSAAALRAATPDFAAIRDRLKADFVVTGTLRRAGDAIRITVRLSSAASEETVWSERYDRPMTDLFSLQDEIAEVVAVAIARHLEVEINIRSAGRPHVGLSSYECMLQGYWHFKKLSRAGNIAARECFERAIALDPSNAAAISWLGVTHCEGWVMDFEPEHAARGVELAARGIALDPANATCHSISTWAHLCVGDLAAALKVSERGMSLNPSDPAVMVNRALALGYDGRMAEARDLLHQAHRLEPVPPPWFGEFGGVLAFAEGRYDATLAGVERLPEPAWDIMYALACYGLMGDKPKARSTLARLAEAGRSPNWALGISREPYADQAIRERLSEGIRLATMA